MVAGKNTYQVRPASVLDCPEILSLDQVSNPHPWGEAMVLEALSSRVNWLLQSVETKAICGWLSATTLLDEAELELVLVDSRLRRQGCARRLLLHWLNSMRSQGVGLFMLEVRQSNHAARALYESLGFAVVGLRKQYYPCETGREAALLMNLRVMNLPVININAAPE